MKMGKIRGTKDKKMEKKRGEVRMRDNMRGQELKKIRWEKGEEGRKGVLYTRREMAS